MWGIVLQGVTPVGIPLFRRSGKMLLNLHHRIDCEAKGHGDLVVDLLSEIGGFGLALEDGHTEPTQLLQGPPELFQR